jgi:hypothetical protein
MVIVTKTKLKEAELTLDDIAADREFGQFIRATVKCTSMPLSGRIAVTSLLTRNQVGTNPATKRVKEVHFSAKGSSIVIILTDDMEFGWTGKSLICHNKQITISMFK